MIVGALILSLIIALPLGAQTSRADLEAALKNRGYTGLTRESRNGRVAYLAQGPAGRRLTIDAPGEIRESDGRLMLEMHDRVVAWQSLTPAGLSFTVDTDLVRLHLVPSRFSDGEKDFLPYTPGGLSFTGTGSSIDYDFRLKADAYFIRFQGILAGERLLLERLAVAVADPAQFIRDNDPSYAAFRIAELQAELEDLRGRMEQAEGSGRDLAAALEKIRADADRTALAAAAALAKGIFGAPKPILPEVRDEVLRIKAGNAAAEPAEIAAELKARGLAATDKQIRALLLVYFGK